MAATQVRAGTSMSSAIRSASSTKLPGHLSDCARNLEGLLSDRQLRETWGLDDDELVRLADNTPLLGAIKAERERRIRMGDAAREAAQRHFAKAPSILNEILQNETISPGTASKRRKRWGRLRAADLKRQVTEERGSSSRSTWAKTTS